ncbi:MAG: DUF5518 domain-containing protein [Candidatus Altiarchaeota archaeon]
MQKFNRALSLIFGIFFSSLLYVILSFIPIFGPLIVGIISGKFSNGDIKHGFLAGLFSGIFGSALLSFLLYSEIHSWNFFAKIIFTGIFIFWNFFSILLTMIGGVLGAIIFRVNKTEEKERKVFLLCNKCKTANLKGEKYCFKCGEKL